MSQFSHLPEFDRELKRLSRKYPTIESDVEDLKPILFDSPTGIGKNFTIIKVVGEMKVVKARVHCESLRSRAIRLIYSSQTNKIEFMFIELYFKGDKENEDKGRIEEYLQNLAKVVGC